MKHVCEIQKKKRNAEHSKSQQIKLKKLQEDKEKELLLSKSIETLELKLLKKKVGGKCNLVKLDLECQLIIGLSRERLIRTPVHTTTAIYIMKEVAVKLRKGHRTLDDCRRNL